MFKKNKVERATLPVVCLIKDLRANIFTAPMVFDNEACAERYFSSIVDSIGIKITDYELYVIGHYYDKTGDFFPLSENTKYLLKTGVEYKDRVDLLSIKESKIQLLMEENSALNEKLKQLSAECLEKIKESEVIVDEE